MVYCWKPANSLVLDVFPESKSESFSKLDDLLLETQKEFSVKRLFLFEVLRTNSCEAVALVTVAQLLNNHCSNRYSTVFYQQQYFYIVSTM